MKAEESGKGNSNWGGGHRGPGAHIDHALASTITSFVVMRAQEIFGGAISGGVERLRVELMEWFGEGGAERELARERFVQASNRGAPLPEAGPAIVENPMDICSHCASPLIGEYDLRLGHHASIGTCVCRLSDRISDERDKRVAQVEKIMGILDSLQNARDVQHDAITSQEKRIAALGKLQGDFDKLRAHLREGLK